MGSDTTESGTPDSSVGRLRSSRDVLATLRSRHRAGDLVVTHVRDADHRDVRLTVVASRKVGSAVRRNRAKRLLREAGRRIAWQPGHDVVLVARAATATATLEPVVRDLITQAERLGVGHGSGSGRA